MTQVGEGTKTTSDEKTPEYHWVQVEYTYANGQPVEGQYHATDGGGMDWFGPLNDKGQVCLSGLPSGNVQVELVPADDEAELKELRKSIKQALDGIVEAEKREAADVEAGYSQYGTISGYGAAIGQGIWDGGVGLLSFAWDTVKTAAEIANYLNPAEKLANLLNAAYKSYQDGELTEAEWRESLLENYKDEEFKDLAELLGYDVRNLTKEKIEDIKLLISEAYEITSFIIDDPETNDIFTQFAKDYADAQSGYEWAEFAGGGIFEIILAALLLVFTAGIGTVAQGASKIRHAAKLKNLGIQFRRLGKILKRKKLNKKVSVGADSKKTVKTKQPDDIDLKVTPAKRLKKKEVKCFKKNEKGTPEEFDRQLAGQEKGMNDLTAQEYLDGRKAYTGKRASTAGARKKFQKGLVDKFRKQGIDGDKAKDLAAKKMKALNALHNPDLYAGGKDMITDFGDAGVNQSIGSQWKSRVGDLDKTAQAAIDNGMGDHKMNVKLKRCK